MKNKDILLDDSFKPAITVVFDSGLVISDFMIGDVTRQNQQVILLAEKGEIKESPKLGVGIASFLDDDNPSDLLREIRENLCEDGQVVRNCSFDINGKLIIDASYESK